MSLNKIHIDQQFLETIEVLGIREGIIAKNNRFEKLDGDEIGIQRLRRLNLKSKVLTLLTLFKEIDSYHSIYDLTNLFNEGLIESSSNIMNTSVDLEFKNNQSDEKKYAQEISYQFVKNPYNKKRIINFLKQHPDNTVVNDYNDFLISKCYDFTLYDLEFGEDVNDELLYKKIGYNSIFYNEVQTSILSFRKSIEKGIYESISQNVSFGCSIDLKLKNPIQQKAKVIDDFYYLARTKLSDEIKYLPNPKTLKEALVIRNRKEIVRFREVLTEWLIVLETGNQKAEEKIRNDIRKANKELKNLSNWKEFKESPINFWINSIGGHVPVLSNVLTAFNMLAGFYETWSEKKYNWTILLQQR